MMLIALVGAIWIIGALVGTGAAQASSAALTVTNSGGLSDPAAGIPRVFTLSGTADTPGRIYVAYRAAGGADCAPSASSDSGRRIGSFQAARVSGPFKFTEARTFDPAGTFMFCIWIARSESSIVVPFSQTLAFRKPVGTIAAMLNPITPQFDQPTAITVYGQSEAPARVFAKIRPAGNSCAASYDADLGRALLSGDAVNGAFSLQTSTTKASTGTYQLCLWLATSGHDPSPIAGPQMQPVYVLGPPPPVGPPPPCVVPGVTHAIRLATMKNRLLAKNCSIGKIRYLRSRRVPRRVIVRLSSRPGSKLRGGSPVTIYVSTGARKAVVK